MEARGAHNVLQIILIVFDRVHNSILDVDNGGPEPHVIRWTTFLSLPLADTPAQLLLSYVSET